MKILAPQNWFTIVLGMVVLLAIFLVDAFVELGVAGGVLYILPVLIAWYGRQSSHVLFAGIIGSLLTIFGYVLSPEGSEEWKVLVNRGLSLLAIWGAVFPCYLSLSKTAGFVAPKTGIAFRIGILAFSLVLVTATLIGVVSFKTANEALIEKEIKIIGDELETDGNQILSQLKAIRQDIQFLAGTPPIQGIIRAQAGGGIDPADGSTDENWMNLLGRIFGEQLRINPYYLQVRYIGIKENGREIVRVDRSGGSVVFTDDSNMQQKGNTDYFAKTIRLEKDELYYSDVTLNREFNKVVLPHQPVMRVATPVFNEDTGAVFGIVVINLDFDLILKKLTRLKGNYYVTNSDGDFLFHPDPSKNFGFDRGQEHLIQRMFPGLSDIYNKVNNSNELWFWEKHEKSASPPILYFRKLPFDKRNPERFLGLVKIKPFSEISISTRQVLENIIWLSVILILLAALVTIYFSRLLTRPLTELVVVANSLAEGEYEKRIDIKGSAESELLAVAMEHLRSNLNSLTKGLRENEDRLKDNAQRLEEERNKLLDESWLKSSLNQIMIQIEGKSSIEDLGSSLLSQLVTMTSAYVGAFYLIKNDVEEPLLCICSSYSYQERQKLREQFSLGEGLVGQCAVEKKCCD